MLALFLCSCFGPGMSPRASQAKCLQYCPQCCPLELTHGPQCSPTLCPPHSPVASQTLPSLGASVGGLHGLRHCYCHHLSWVTQGVSRADCLTPAGCQAGLGKGHFQHYFTYFGHTEPSRLYCLQTSELSPVASQQAVLCYHVPSEAKHFRHFTLCLEKWLSVEGLVSVHDALGPSSGTDNQEW